MKTVAYLSDREVAQRYGIGKSTVWKAVQEGRMPKPVRLTARTTRWRIEDLEEWEEQRRAAPYP